MKITKIFIFVCIVTLFVGCKKKDDKTDSPSIVSPHDFLSSEKYDQLIIQIQAVNGYELTQQTTDNLVAFLQQRLNKPVGIQIVKSTISSPGKSVFTLSDLKAIEQKNRTEHTSGKILTAYFFVADADYSENQGNSKVLGIAYSSSAMVIFGKTIKEFTGDYNQPSEATLETTVIEHEFCHILGLVNNGTGMQTAHQDEPHGKHCNNTNCLMYYEIESSASMANIFGSGIPSLDNNCISDLQGNGGK